MFAATDTHLQIEFLEAIIACAAVLLVGAPFVGRIASHDRRIASIITHRLVLVIIVSALLLLAGLFLFPPQQIDASQSPDPATANR
jgi:hypothetical protein